MTIAKAVTRNSIYLFAGDSTGYLLQLILVVYLARYLGDIGYGKYSFSLAFTSLFLIISDLGLSALSIREICRDRQRSGNYLANTLIIKVFLSIIALTLMVVTINLMNYPTDTTIAVYIMGAAAMVSSFTISLRALFRAFEKMEYETITKIIEKILAFGLIIPILLAGYGLIPVVIATFLIQIGIFLLTLALVIKKFVALKPSINYLLALRLLREAIPFGLASVFGIIYFQTDTIMLSFMKGDDVVGWYNAAYRLVMGGLFIPGAFVGAVYPVLSRSHVTSKAKSILIYQLSFKFLFALALPLGVGTSLIADRIIQLLYGDAFAPSITALRVLIWVVSILFLNQIIGYTLASTNNQIMDTRITGIAALFNVGLNLILIPSYSYIGAGIASVISQIFVFICEFYYLRKIGYDIDNYRFIYKVLFATVIMSFLIYTFNNYNINIIIIILSAVAIYFASLYLLDFFKNECQIAKFDI